MSNSNFEGAHGFVLNNPQFNEHKTINKTVNKTVNVAGESGLEKLLKASMPDAFHDSGARDPPRCHPGTRLDYIDKISRWGSGASQRHPERILWMDGPAGVGKSAIAQSCAELLSERKQLGAAFFFSRPNQRDDPMCLFPSLSYQFTTTSEAYADILNRKIQRDPTLLEKSLARQFHELLVKPLEELQEAKKGVEECVIIIDGLDECAGVEAQEQIVKTVARSVQDATTPFRWAFFSRPESHIVACFTSSRVRPLCFHLELPVSREIDHEIYSYLIAEFKRIREKHGLPSSWPSEEDLATLVDRSAGLFIYASTVIRFVGQRNSLGPIDQLRLILLITRQAASDTGSDHPLSELDLFYTLIMRCIPSKILPTILKILLLHETTPRLRCRGIYDDKQIFLIANSLGLSESQFRNACAALRSVLELSAKEIKFYHASFMDFLQDPHRSKEFCIYGDCLDTVRQDLLERLNHVHAQSTERLAFDFTWSCAYGFYSNEPYGYLVDALFFLCQYPRPLASLTAAGLVKFQYQAVFCLHGTDSHGGAEIVPEDLRQNVLPVGLRDKVIRRARNPAVYFHKPSGTNWEIPYVLGQGRNRVVWWSESDKKLSQFSPYPSIFNS